MNSVHRFDKLREEVKKMSKSEMKRVKVLSPELVGEISDEALEEAAKMVDQYGLCTFELSNEFLVKDIAQAICALKSRKINDENKKD